MNPTEMFAAASILLLTVGLVAWAGLAMARIEAQLQSIGGFDGMLFEIEPRAADNAEGRR